MRVAAVLLAAAACSSPPAGPGAAVAERPPIVAAAAWGSQPLPIPDDRLHELRCITVHHAGVVWRAADDPLAKLPALQTWGQRERGWPDVPYHFLIAPDGRIFAGRPLRFAGDTNTDYDTRGHALVQLWGSFDVQRVRLEQLEAAVALIAWLCAEHGIDPATIRGHRDVAARTSCPGRDLHRYVAQGRLRGWVAARLRGEPAGVAVAAPLDGGPRSFVPLPR